MVLIVLLRSLVFYDTKDLMYIMVLTRGPELNVYNEYTFLFRFHFFFHNLMLEQARHVSVVILLCKPRTSFQFGLGFIGIFTPETIPMFLA